MKRKIAIVVIATNSYFTLGLRFINRFHHFYHGNDDVYFHFFADIDPRDYIPDGVSYQYHPSMHRNWVDGVNSKFENILSLQDSQFDYLYYVDADTGIRRHFTMEPFFGDLMGAEHFMNHSFNKAEDFPFDRHSVSSCYVPIDSSLPNRYYQGATFGGCKNSILAFCSEMMLLQAKNKKINHEPGVNDESYLNYYFHYNPPENTLLYAEFPFVVSCKGGIDGTRHPDLDLKEQKETIRNNRNKLIDIREAKVVFD